MNDDTSDLSLLTEEIPHLRRYARMLTRDGHSADDLVQSCLERAISRFHLWQRDLRLRPWLLTIMHNLFISGARRRAAEPLMVGYSDALDLPAAGNQDTRLDSQRVLDATHRLPEDQRLAILLVAIEEMSYKDAAEVLDIPVGTLMSRLSRGRAQLRQYLGMSSAPTLRRVK